MGLLFDGLMTMQFKKYCPVDGVALVPSPQPWRENQLEYDMRHKYARCPVCGKTAKELFRLNEPHESVPDRTAARPKRVPPTEQQRSFKRFVQEETAKILQEPAKRLLRDVTEQSKLKDQWYRQQYGR